MRGRLLVIGSVLALPAIATAIFFPSAVTTGGAGMALPIACPGCMVTPTLAGQAALGLLGATLGLAGVAALSSKLKTESSYDSYGYSSGGGGYGGHASGGSGYGGHSSGGGGYGYKRAGPGHSSAYAYYRRHKRQANMFDYNAVNSMVEQVFTDISERGMEGCFERLVCDISADPHRFQTTSLPIITSIQSSRTVQLSTQKAKAVSARLFEAMRYGQVQRTVRACEEAFNRCEWSGSQMDAVISSFNLDSKIVQP